MSKSLLKSSSANRKGVAAVTAPLPTSKRITVPFSNLFLSKSNVRSAKDHSEEGIRRLAAMIESGGLLSDLHVSRELKNGLPTGRFGVEAGGRRWRALGLLVSASKMHPDEPINCKEVEEGSETSVSLAENLGQEAMHPADEFAAFAALHAQKKSLDDIANHFGVSVVHVQRRMRLAAVAPSLVAMFREGRATLDQMMALASVDDQKRQVAVWKGLPEYSRSAGAIKRKLTETEVNATDPRVKLITRARYEASGGTTRKDLFTDEVFLDDPGLVDLLVAEVLTERADAVRAEGWAWVEIIEQMGYEEQQRFREPPVRYMPESDAARVEREALEAKLDALEDRYNDGADSVDDSEDAMSALEAIDAECDVIRGELEAARRARIDTSGYDKAQLGAVVTTQAGTIQVQRGLMTAEAARAAAQSNDRAGRGDASGALAGGKGAPEEFSERLMADLTSHRTAAMQAALIGNAQVALAVLAHGMASDLFGRHGAGSNPARVSVKGCRAGLERDATNFGESAAAKVLDAERDRWESLLPEDPNDWLSWLIAQPQATVLSLLAYCTAQSVDLVQRRSRPTVEGDKIAAALSLDMADWWTPGADNFLAHVPKAKVIEAVTAAAGDAAAKDLPKMKKPEAVAAAAALLAGTRWLPTPLLVVSVADAASTD